MIYREAGDFKTTYAADAQAFPIRMDRRAYYALFIALPFWVAAIYLLNSAQA